MRQNLLRDALVLVLALVVAACADEPDTDDLSDEDEREAIEQPDRDPGLDGDEPADPDEDFDEDPADSEDPTDDPADAPEPAPLDEVAVTLTHVADPDGPTAGAVSPDGTLHIAERSGPVRPLTDDGLGDPVVDLSGDTTTDTERGLLGIAFDDENLYVSYTDLSGNSRVDRFGWQDGAAVSGSRQTLLVTEQPYGNHNGGGVVIGPDGALWLGLGDGGGSGDPLGAGQDLGTELGALLRLNPATGEAADGNPFAEDDDADPRIWAYGLRNPWRFSFDRATDDLWIADVGQGDREEVNWVPAGEGAGANFGWNLMEGTMGFAGSEPDDHWPPLYEYETNVDGCAITGGYVYRGTAVEGLQGAYLFSDYCDGGLRALRQEDGDVTESIDFGVEGAGMVVSFAEDADGELYVLTFGDGVLRVDPG